MVWQPSDKATAGTDAVCNPIMRRVAASTDSIGRLQFGRTHGGTLANVVAPRRSQTWPEKPRVSDNGLP